MITGTADRWQRLGALLIQRRTALDPRWHNRREFADATRMSYRLAYDIEEGRRANFGTSTLAAIEVAYGLVPGAIGRFLAGGELEVKDAPPLRAVPSPPLSYDESDVERLLEGMDKLGTTVRAHFDENMAAVRDVGTMLPGQVPPGVLLFESRKYQDIWDGMIGRTFADGQPYTLPRMALAVAMWQARDEAAERRAASG